MGVCNNPRFYTNMSLFQSFFQLLFLLLFQALRFPILNEMYWGTSLVFHQTKQFGCQNHSPRFKKSLKRRCRWHLFHLALGYFGLQTEPLNRKAEEWCFSSSISLEFLVMSLLLLRRTFIVPCKIAIACFTILLYILILWYYLLDIILIRH